jgi:hypothetical protein
MVESFSLYNFLGGLFLGIGFALVNQCGESAMLTTPKPLHDCPHQPSVPGSMGVFFSTLPRNHILCQIKFQQSVN